MPLLTEKRFYGMEGKLKINRSFEQKNPKLIHEERSEKSNKKSLFCSPCNKLVVNPPMASHVLIKHRSAKVFKNIRKTDCSCKFSDTFVKN